MENFNEELMREPKYTKMWLGLQLIYAFVISGMLAVVTAGIWSLGADRVHDGLLSVAYFDLLRDAAGYCFATILITLTSVMLIELAFRRGANLIQSILIGCSLSLFYLLLLALSEHIPFWGAYLIVSAMTVGLITWFVNAIVGIRKASVMIAAILTIEYGVILLLVYLGSMVLLVGSLLLFALMGLAMYLTLRLKMDNEELVLK